jgi:hypothetical protein
MKRRFQDNDYSDDDESNNDIIVGVFHSIIERNFDCPINITTVKFDNTNLNNEVFYDIIRDVCDLLEDENKLILDVIGDKITILYKFKEIDIIYMNDNYDCMALIEFKR